MNFSPFGSHFPGIHQFVSNASTQDNTNRYHTVNANTNHFNQNQILSKFRNDEAAATNVKYSNSHHSSVSTTQYGTVSYSQPTEAKEQKMVATTTAAYQSQNKDSISQIQHSDLTQDLTALLQQTETKRGTWTSFFWIYEFDLTLSSFHLSIYFSFTKC